MIYLTEHQQLHKQTDHLIDCISQSILMEEYISNKIEMNQSKESQAKIQAFVQAKEEFRKVESYGTYAPDYEEKRKDLSDKKRKLDSDEKIKKFRDSEQQLALILDEITLLIAKSVSEEIPTDLHMHFPTKTSKSCNCKKKGGCNCSHS